MKTNITILTAVALLVAFSLNAQVAINTDGGAPDGSAMLEIESTSGGILIPRMNQTQRDNISSPATGLLIWQTDNTPGFYYNAGTPGSPNWIGIGGESDDWTTEGNSGTTVGTNFLGTTDTEPLAFYTDDTERMRILDNGQIAIDNGYTAPGSDNKFEVNANATHDDAISGYSVDGYGLYGYSTNSYAVYGYSNDTYTSIRAQNINTDGTALVATGNNVSGATISGGSGASIRGSKYGIYAKALNDADGTGIGAVGNNYATLSYLTSGTGGAFSGYHGVYGKGRNSSQGIGVIGVGNDSTTFHYISGGNGGAFSGAKAGVYGFGSDATAGTGVIGIGNQGNSYYSLPGGSGGAFTGDVCGVYGIAANSSGNRYGGYFSTADGQYAYVGGNYSGTNRKIVGNGTVSTIVKNTNGEIVTLVCPEAPESLFQDYGIGQLVNGKAHITIDPDLAININVSSEHPLKVFITLEGDCNGVYVTNKSADGFDVVELQGGMSTVPFSWQIVATRANEEYVTKDGKTEISDYSHRFQPAPGPLEQEMEKLYGKSAEGKNLFGNSVSVEEIEVKEKMDEKVSDGDRKTE